jgi:homoserine dehydrogenase
VPSDELLPYREAPPSAHEGGFYIRLAAKDVPGALAAITTRMGEKSISIDSVIQRSDLAAKAIAPDGSPSRTVVMITQQTLESSVREALAQIAADGFIVGEPQLIRIETL